MRIPGYVIQRTIGKGGMATVYLAEQESLQRLVALKTLRVEFDPEGPEDTVHDSEELAKSARFVNEGRLVASLQHPHVVQIYDIGATPEVMYISMEYVAGGNLQSRLDAPLPVAVAIDILLKIGLALETAHRRGIIHRDVKPGNILFRADDTPLLSDFGIAKQVDEQLELTTTGHVLGSPFYISPEQAEGLAVDGRTDLYSLGIIFYEMLTGARPYDGTSAIKVILQHLQAPVPRLSAELSDFQPLLDRLLAKDPNTRFESAIEMVRFANALGSSVPVATGKKPKLPRPGPISDDIVKGFRTGILEDLANDRLVLPSLPDVVLSVRRELERPDSTAEALARAVATDPALGAQLLRVANSAFYFGQAPVGDLQRAVVRLGNGVVQQVVMMLVVAQLYDVDARVNLREHLTELWRHSTLVAALSEQIAARVPGLVRESALLAGLIHDIGALPVLVWAEPIPNIMNNEKSLRALLAELRGELGTAILEQWHYPDSLIVVPQGHEDLARESSRSDYVDVVQVANLLSYVGTDDPMADIAWWDLPSAQRLKLDRETGESLLESARDTAESLAGVLGDE
ncbi:MAG: serine/threonine protein kinase [Gammaproteobacteria bacterium]|jgi:serine/threonine protein kinase